MSTEAAAAMKNIVAQVAPMLKDAGFRRRRHGFHRRTEDGLIDVVHFQMGPYEPPGTVEIPPYRRNLYGRFTINLAIFCHDMPTFGPPGRKYDWINEYSCHLRKRIGNLMPDERDIWWPLEDESFAARVSIATLTDYGLPWLDRYPTRASILEAFRRGEQIEMGMAPRAAVDIAALLLAIGERAEARSVLVEHLRRADFHPSHRPVVLNYAAEQGLGDLSEVGAAL
jgi:hypothetical protein